MSNKRKFVAAAAALLLVGISFEMLRGRRHAPSEAQPPKAPTAFPVEAAVPRPPPTGSARVRVYDDGAPFPGRTVVFHDRGGLLLASGKTADDGSVSAGIDPGASVTVAYGTSVKHLYSVFGLVPGDEIVIGELEDEGEGGDTVATANLKLPDLRRGAVRHTLTLGVGATEASAGREIPMPVLERFVSKDKRFRVLGEAFDDAGEPVAYTFANAKLGDGGVVPIALPAWSTDWRYLTITLANTPEAVKTVSGDVQVAVGEHQQFERRPKVAHPPLETTLRFAVPPPLARDIAYRVKASYEGDVDAAIYARRAATFKSEVRVDFREALPRVSGAIAERTPSGSVRVRFRVDGDPSRADATVVRLAWPTTREHVWTILAPPGITTLDLPRLPPELADWQPGNETISAAVGIFDASAYDGYDVVRRKGIPTALEPPEEPEGDLVFRAATTGDLTF